MRYTRETPNIDLLKEIISQKGLTTRQVSQMVLNDSTHRDLISEMSKKPDTRSSSLVKLCNILDISLELLFQKSDEKLKSPSIVGNNNVINSSFVNNDIASLRAENRALKMVIQEKNLRIDDMKKTNEDLGKRLDMVLNIKSSNNQ